MYLKRAICIHEGFKIFSSNSYSPKSTATLLPLSLDLKLLTKFLFFFFTSSFLLHVLHLWKIFTHLFIYKTFYFYIQLIQSRFTKKKKLYFDCAKKILLGSWGLGVFRIFYFYFSMCKELHFWQSLYIQSFHSNSRDLI